MTLWSQTRWNHRNKGMPMIYVAWFSIMDVMDEDEDRSSSWPPGTHVAWVISQTFIHVTSKELKPLRKDIDWLMK